MSTMQVRRTAPDTSPSLHRPRLVACATAAMVALLVLGSTALAVTSQRDRTHRFSLTEKAEVVASITARCDRCDWAVVGREAVVLRAAVDDQYVQHVALLREGTAEYHVLLGERQPGSHVLTLDLDASLSAPDVRDSWRVDNVSFSMVSPRDREHQALALAPYVHARPDTVGAFNDVPAFMYYEIEKTSRGARYRYTVIFSNEDGGTPSDRLMATWGRTTDIEYIYSVEIDARGTILDEDMQGPDHKTLPYRGARLGRHPQLWVSTANNMVLDSGRTSVRYGLAPQLVELANVSREAVMDEHPWLYALAAKELQRENKIVADAPAGRNQITDPRRFVTVEGCGEVGTSALAFAIQVRDQWLSSDRGVGYRIQRDGCFRAAIPLPSDVNVKEVRGLRAQAFPRSSSKEAPPPPATPVRITRINRAFVLDDDYRPRAPFYFWNGEMILTPGGPARDFPFQR